MEQLPQAFAAMRAYPQFVLWKAVPSKKRAGKFDKFPCDPSGNVTDAHNPKVWQGADEAIATATSLGDNYGVGFVFTSNDPFYCVDIDGAYDGTRWSPLATQLCTDLSGAAVEVSHSGTGLHIIGSYDGDEFEHKCKNIKLHLELYTSDRFIALTGTGVTGDSSHKSTSLGGVVTQYFSGVDEERPTTGWTTTHVEDSNPIQDDAKLIAKALASRSSDVESMFNMSDKTTFKDLWNCNTAVLAVSYPHDQTDGEFDRSSADAALAQHLAFWTGGNCERIDRLMRASSLVREKWDYHKSYMERTITNAVGRQANWYSVGLSTTEITEVTSVLTPVMRDGYQLLAADKQVELFEGCVYIASDNRIFCPNGAMLKQETFNAMYGGYNFSVGDDGEKVTKKAWEAFTESQLMHFPKADATIFRPDLQSGCIVEVDGWRYVNTYVPVEVPMMQGDVTPFTNHLRKLLPDERDQTIVLSYMAACVQHKGYKIQWAPLLQGCEGNGKTLLTRCVANAIGKRYTHWPKAARLDSEFNGWLANKVFIAVEDIFVANHRSEVLETLKPMITGGDGIEIQRKSVDQTSGDICCNFMFNSNHKDALKDVTKSRRYSVFYTAQQEKCDLQRDGMTGDYFSKLYNWLKNENGYAKVTNFLNEYVIPMEFDPTGECQTAPETSSTAEAATLGMGEVEQEILEAIDEGRAGFAGGWVSSFALDVLIKDMRKDHMVKRTKRKDLMRSLGYDYHPGLRDGRVNNVIVDTVKDGKPRLYIKVGHIHANLEGGADIAKHYMAAQGDVLAIKSLDTSVNNG
jgi:hypothetical protein